jgi:hypothetical protein
VKEMYPGHLYIAGLSSFMELFGLILQSARKEQGGRSIRNPNVGNARFTATRRKTESGRNRATTCYWNRYGKQIIDRRAKINTCARMLDCSLTVTRIE